MAGKTIAEHLADLKATREAHNTKLKAIGQASIDEARSMNTAEQEEFDTIQGEIKSLDSDIRRYAQLEAAAAATATPASEQAIASEKAMPSDGRPQAPVIIKRHEDLAPGILFARHAMCVFAAKGNMHEARHIAQSNYGDDSPVTKALNFANGRKLEAVIKAAVAAGTTTDSAWAKPLVEYVNYAGDFVEFLRPRTLIGQFGANGIPSLRRIPFNVHIKGQTTGGAGYWVGEGAAKPVTAFGFNDAYHGWFKVAAISVLTDELIRFSDPSAETYVRDSLSDVLVARMDTDFIDPTFAGTANVSPASITNGITQITSSGNDADAIRVDLNALWAAGEAADNVYDSPVYVMRGSTARVAGSLRNALGQPEFPGLTAKGGTLDGVPVVTSNYVPAGFVFLVNASDIYFSDDGQATVDFSNEASINMVSAPGTDTASVVSMFQNDMTALRAHRFVNWSRRRDTGVAVLKSVAWGQPVTP